MKFLDVLKGANQNLLRNKLRTFLTILAVFIGSFTIITNTAIQSGVNSFIDGQVAAYGGDGYLLITTPGAMTMLGSQLFSAASSEPEEYTADGAPSAMAPITAKQVEEIKDLPAINPDSVATMKTISATYITSSETDKKYTVQLQAMAPGQITIDTVAGTSPNMDADEYEVTLPPNYPKALGYENDEDIVGQTVTIAVQDQVTLAYDLLEAKVVGVQAPGIVTQNAALVNTALSDAVYDLNTKYYPDAQKAQVYIVTAEYDFENYSADDVKAELEEIGLTGMTVSDLVGQVKAFFDVVIAVFNIFGLIALLAAAIGIINTLFMSVQERTREIGLDKALGMSSGWVFLSFSIEAIALGFWGSVMGTIASMVAGNIANAAFHSPGGFLEAFPTFYLVEFKPINVVLLILLIMTIAFLAGTLPARKAAAKSPIDALRYE